jgi:hypothetical protein
VLGGDRPRWLRSIPARLAASAPAAGAADEGNAVAPAERYLFLVGAARRRVAVGAQTRRLPLLLAWEEDHGALAHQLAWAGAHHVLEEAVAARHEAVAHESDADRGVVEDQLLLGERALHALLGGALLGDIGDQPDVALVGVAGLHRAPVDAAPEGGAVLAAQPIARASRLVELW